MDLVISPELLSFIKDVITSFITWDLLVFFYTEQERKFKLEEIAERIGRPKDEVNKSLVELTNIDIIRKSSNGEVTYVYNMGNNNEKELTEFIEKLSDREARLIILGVVLNGQTK